jgi:hypothetical protein
MVGATLTGEMAAPMTMDRIPTRSTSLVPVLDEMQNGEMGVSRGVRSGEKKGWAAR